MPGTPEAVVVWRVRNNESNLIVGGFAIWAQANLFCEQNEPAYYGYKWHQFTIEPAPPQS